MRELNDTRSIGPRRYRLSSDMMSISLPRHVKQSKLQRRCTRVTFVRPGNFGCSLVRRGCRLGSNCD